MNRSETKDPHEKAWVKEKGDGYVFFDSHWAIHPYAERERWMDKEASVKTEVL